ncbi:hypothetical protein [Microbacterium sp. NPDC080220]|uniref:hypothetical protein n=1 Tax=Microbacterium sp. NPDC080220 TaxID=3161017 RepID=UPI0034176FC6
MDEIWAWAADDGLRLLGDIIIPVAAILIPTIIAVRVARRERERAESAAVEERAARAADEQRARALAAGGNVISVLASFVSMNPRTIDMHGHLAALRGSIAVYRAWIPIDDISGDWLALKHTQGMKLWGAAMTAPDVTIVNDQPLFPVALSAAQQWAQDTIETFSGWLRGDTSEAQLSEEGADLLHLARPRPSQWAGAETTEAPGQHP